MIDNRKIFYVKYKDTDCVGNTKIVEDKFHGFYGFEKFIYCLLTNKFSILDIAIWDSLEDDEPL